MTFPIQYWTESRCAAVGALALGYSYDHAAKEAGVCSKTIYNWMRDPEFCAEVDRMTIMIGESSRAERLRQAMRVLRSLQNEAGVLRTNKDSLDWLKYMQSETDGVKLDLGKLTELDNNQESSPAIDVTPGHQPLLSEVTEPLDTQPIAPATDDDHKP